MKPERISRDLISSTDFLPTICEAAGASVPANTDGVSFLPQIKGEVGKPREWLYCWYSPRLQSDMTVREFAFDDHYKLYRTGEFYDLKADPFEKSLLEGDKLQITETAAVAKLQRVLDQYNDTRPVELDRAFEQTLGDNPPKKKVKKNKK